MGANWESIIKSVPPMDCGRLHFEAGQLFEREKIMSYLRDITIGQSDDRQVLLIHLLSELEKGAHHQECR